MENRQTEDSPEMVEINRESLIIALEHLEIVVCSLDRIGSYSASCPKEEALEILYNFCIDWNVFNRLAEARHLLSEPFPDDPDDVGDDMSELERRMDRLPVWTSGERLPPEEFVFPVPDEDE